MRPVDLIELHDSVAELRREARSVVIDLRPAYVHHWEDPGTGWIGTGLTQDAMIEIGCRPESVSALGPVKVRDGWLQVGDKTFELIPVPLEAIGPVVALLDLANGASVKIKGTHVRTEFLGAATFVEALPPEWAPDVDE